MEYFGRRITDREGLRSRYRAPSELVQRKKFALVDAQFRQFIAMSPFCLVATSDGAGNTDVSPRGGPAGFVRVLDETHLLVPDLSGNNLLDTLGNIVDNGSVGLLFIVPGEDETVRVNGRACLTVEPSMLATWDGELRTPKAAIGVEVTEVYHHCAKAFRRSSMWQPANWPAGDDVPDFCETYAERFDLVEAGVLRTVLEDGYTADLAADAPD